MQRYYLRPSLLYQSITDILPLQDYGNQELLTSRIGGTLAVGAHVTTDYEFEVGVSMFEDKVEFLDSIDSRYKAIPLHTLINIDNLDNVNFPQVGMKAKLEWTKEMKVWGSDYDYEQVYFELEKPFSFYSNNITLFMKYGNTYQNDDIDRLSGLFSLGGLFNLSGYAPYSFLGDNVAFGILKYTYEIKDGGFFGTLNAPLYAGFSLESGDSWSNPAEMDLKYSGTVYIAADTFMGPFYFAFGGSDKGERSVYLYLGEKF
jgi:NTE family protein